jgi:4-diphosphocytidyl-2-C-methyl-D-erythritol kinase
MRRETRTRALRVIAPAKINLTLRVLGRRADGYHDIRTTFQSVALHDVLWFRSAPGPFHLECSDPSCPVDRANIVWRAAQLMWSAAGRSGRASGVRVYLDKRIPLQAGLGGGSSDAAAALRALAVLWRVRRLRDVDLWALAARLGADVPFFVDGGTALGVERGDVLFPLADFRSSSVVLAVPDFGVSTTDAYAWLDGTRRGNSGTNARSRPRVATTPSGTLGMGEWTNDLEGAVRARHPAIGRLVSSLKRQGASYAGMSGSGSAVFGLFATSEDSRRAAAALPGTCRVLVTRTLGRREYRTAVAVRNLPATRSIV